MGVYLSEPNKEKNIKHAKHDNMEFISAEMQGWRKTMEDACIHNADIGDNHALFGVFDGHGGHEVSRYVSSIFEKQLKNNKQFKAKKYELALDEVFKRVDQMIQSAEGQQELYKIRFGGEANYSEITESQRDFIGGAVGCTANVVLITPTAYIVANAGDSRAVLCRGGKALDLSKDHKPESPEEQERVKGAGGAIRMGRVNGGLNLTRSFGDFDYKQVKTLPYDKQMITCKPDIKTFEKSQQDEFILMGCDGIWQKYVENSDGIIRIVKQKIAKIPEKTKLIEELLDGLLAEDTMGGIGCDNMTAILIIPKQ